MTYPKVSIKKQKWRKNRQAAWKRQQSKPVEKL
jgi:hypothetical protein